MVGTRDRIEDWLDRRGLARWTRSLRRASGAGLDRLGRDRRRARALRARLDEFLAVAENRLAEPRPGSSDVDRPGGTDWSWRPDLWRRAVEPAGRIGADPGTGLGPQVKLFHDCPLAEMALRQVRTTGPAIRAPYGLVLDVYRFSGSFLSLAVDLPEEAVTGLRKRHLVRLGLRIETERPLDVFARLNIRHGPNTEQILRELPREGGSGEAEVEFDLAYTRLNEKRVEAAWLDLIFEGLEMNRVAIGDMTFARYPRAEL